MTLRATSNPFDQTATVSLRWEDFKDRVDIVRVATNLLGEPPGRGGERGRRSWWNCPFHHDKNPSFAVDPEYRNWKCFGCGEHGDAPELVMKLRGVGFKDAIAFLAVGTALPSGSAPTKSPSRKATLQADPDALTRDEATAIVEQSAERLWSQHGTKALSYLRGRGLTDETIRKAKLGWTPQITKVAWSPCGITIPWFRDDALVILKVRCDASYLAQFPSHKGPPKYVEAYRSPFASDRDDPPCFPGLDIIEPGLPLAVVEGELDTILLGQELADLAVVLTLGGATNHPGPSTRVACLAAWPRYAAHDSDDAGDKSAASWPKSFVRIRPPGYHKDWCDAFAAGINLRRWWGEVLKGVERPSLYSWDELAKINGGGGIVIDKPPSREELMATLTAAFDGSDPYDLAERLAIQEVA